MNENVQAVKDLFTQDAHAIDDMHEYTKKNLKQWEKQVIATFPPRAKILDIGCGMGREAFCLSELGFSVTGVDLSDTVIETARQTASSSGLDVEFIVSNGLDLPFEDAAFDVVIIWAQTFGLFYGEENQQYILGECRRVLRPEGMLSFSGHDRLYLAENYAQYLKGTRFYAYDSASCYWESFTMDELKGAAVKAGFTIIDCQRGLVYTEEDGTILHCTCRK